LNILEAILIGIFGISALANMYDAGQGERLILRKYLLLDALIDVCLLVGVVIFF